MTAKRVISKKSPSPEPEPKSGIASRIVHVGDIDSYTAMLVYGRGGTGKTAFVSTFPKPILILDIKEKGTETIRKIPQIDVLSIDTWDDLEEIYWWLEKKDRGYRTVALDQITALQGLAMDWIREENNMKVSDTFSKRDWGQISGMMQTWLLNYRNLWNKDMHVCFVAHERSTEAGEEMDQMIDPTVGARVMPSLSSFLNGAVSTIGNTFIRERHIKKDNKRIRKVDYCMRIGPHAIYTTKVRKPPDGPPIPDVLVNPTFAKIEAIGRGEDITIKSK